MYIKQVSVFIENRTGRLEEFCTLLGRHGIDLIALSLADTEKFGLLRIIVSDWARAIHVLRTGGYTANVTDVIAAAVPDSPGGLAGALKALREGGIAIEYLYSFLRRMDGDAVIIFRVDQPEKAASLFAGKGIRLLGEEALTEK